MRDEPDRLTPEQLREIDARLGLTGGPSPDEYPPEQRGDEWHAAHPTVNGHVEGETVPDVQVPKRITAADVATIADLVRAGSEVRWLWPGWIPRGVLTALAAEGGKGKTRFCADLMRRIRHSLPWPDGSAMNAPADGLWLWVMADNHHDEIVTLARDFSIVPNIRINAHRSDPYGGVTLETADDLAALDGRIRAVRPVAVVIDTVGNATDRNLSKQEDAKAFYFPLQVLSRRYSCVMMCLTHLNATGHFLGRRVLEKVRVAIRMDKPDSADERRSLEVVKSNSKKPPALGLTMGDKGNDYDQTPPKAPEFMEPGQAAPSAVDRCCDWLRKQLAEGPVRVAVIRDKADAERISSKTLYAARDRAEIDEYTSQGRKWWALPGHRHPHE